MRSNCSVDTAIERPNVEDGVDVLLELTWGLASVGIKRGWARLRRGGVEEARSRGGSTHHRITWCGSGASRLDMSRESEDEKLPSTYKAYTLIEVKDVPHPGNDLLSGSDLRLNFPSWSGFSMAL